MDLAVIILIGQERIHLARCVARLAPLRPTRIYLVESQPDDGGLALARETAAKCGLRVETLFNPWPGLQSVQFNWALGQVEESGWILRLDADEYLTAETCERLDQGLGELPPEVCGLTLELKRRFCGGEIRHATTGIRQVRLFRAGRARYAETLMDERLVVEGEVRDFDGAFYDDNLNSLAWWKEKHRGYAKREARQALEGTSQDPRKVKYYRLPPYFRAILYFLVRYVAQGGFLDGVTGWRWNFWQGLWYRWIVDREIERLSREERVDRTAGVDLSQYQNRHGWRNMLGRFIWKGVWTFLARPTPRWVLNWWRVLLMRLFGAKVGANCRVPGCTDIWYPSRMTMGRNVWIDVSVKVYCVDSVKIGNNVIISDSAYLCTAQHDIVDREFKLITAPIVIGDSAWIAARAIILPGVTIGEGAVVAAGAVVTRDVPPWTVVAGSPARIVKKRELKG